MYHDKTDTPATCRTSSLVEELGMVEYVFSDKTGTLTCNQMEFKQCSIAGIQYADAVSEDRRATSPDDLENIHDFNRLRSNLREGHESAPAIHHFLSLLAICHTVIPEMTEKGHIKYQAASPDEGALVQGAVELGYKFTARKPKSVIIETGGQELEYELLAVCEFNSTRKRMSAIYRCPDGKIRCYCKGADTVILERLSDQNPHVEATLRHLEEYASEGLRTLCLAMREIPEQEFQEWYQIFDTAATTVGGTRADELDKAAEIIEHDFFLLGATAIEDRLQDRVPETIHTLQQANIKVWVLTGDRQETAINIGMSCKLLSEDMMLLIVNEESAAATRDNLQKKLDAIRTQGDGTIEMETLALVIDGKSLTYALEKDLEKLFLDLAVMCKAVICCRVSPLQKALVVKLVKKHKKQSILLAIGDGANDVSMIQAAHIGVGISGMEGLQAARSADVAIAQFRFLRKLLLVHGAWSYQRVSKTILFSFYKNIALYMTQFWVCPRISQKPLKQLLTRLIDAVHIPKRLFGTGHLRIVDAVLLQRLLHSVAAAGARHPGPVHLGAPPGPLSTAVHDGPAEQLLQAQGVCAVDRQRILPLHHSVHLWRANLVRRPDPRGRQDGWPLGLGHRPVRCSPPDGVGQGGLGDEQLDQVPRAGDSGQHGHLVRVHRRLRHRGAHGQLFDRVPRRGSAAVHEPDILAADAGPGDYVSAARLCVEVRQAYVPAADVPSHPGDSKVQHSRLQTQVRIRHLTGVGITFSCC